MTGSIPVHTYPCNNLMYHGKRYTIALVNRNNSKDLFYGPVYGKLMLENIRGPHPLFHKKMEYCDLIPSIRAKNSVDSWAVCVECCIGF